MEKLFSIGFWSAAARFILRNRIGILAGIVLATVLFASQWQHMRFTYTEANLLPDDHPYNLEYQEFLNIFGEEGNLIVLGVKDDKLFTPDNFKAWMKLSQELQEFDQIELSLSIGDLKKLQKQKKQAAFELVPFIEDTLFTPKSIAHYQHELFNKLPFYEGLIYNPAKLGPDSLVFGQKHREYLYAPRLYFE